MLINIDLKFSFSVLEGNNDLKLEEAQLEKAKQNVADVQAKAANKPQALKDVEAKLSDLEQSSK